MSASESSSPPGPARSTERTLSGVLVHLLGLPLGVFGPGVVYLLSNRDFTRENARNAVNWHLSVLAVSFVAFGIFFLGADTITLPWTTIQGPLLPGVLGSVFGIVGIVLVFVAMGYLVATLFFPWFAAYRAVTGSAWEYPFAREFLSGRHE
jgi:uncharacterized Tic20 family protein